MTSYFPVVPCVLFQRPCLSKPMVAKSNATYTSDALIGVTKTAKRRYPFPAQPSSVKPKKSRIELWLLRCVQALSVQQSDHFRTIVLSWSGISVRRFPVLKKKQASGSSCLNLPVQWRHLESAPSVPLATIYKAVRVGDRCAQIFVFSNVLMSVDSYMKGRIL